MSKTTLTNLSEQSNHNTLPSTSRPHFASHETVYKTQVASQIPKPTSNNNILTQNQKKDLLKAILSSNTLKFTGKSLINYANGKNNNDLREKIQQIAGQILISFNCYSVEEDVFNNSSSFQAKKEYFLKIYTYDEEDFHTMDRKDFSSLGENIKRIDNNIPLLLHTTLTKKINIDDVDFKEKMYNEYGIINMQRIIKNEELQYTTVKIECSDVNSWKSLLVKGLQLESSKFNIVTEWEFEPLFCYKCLAYKHHKDNCPNNTILCRICTSNILFESENHTCVMKCKWCNLNTHKSNDKCCEKYKVEKNWKNSNYEKLKNLLDIQKTKYNMRRNQHSSKISQPLINKDNFNANSTLVSILRNELDTKLKSFEEKSNEEKRLLEKQIQDYKQDFEKFREQQNIMNKKIKDKIVSSNKIAKSGYIHIKYLVKEQMKDAKIRQEMDKELKDLEEEKNDLSDNEAKANESNEEDTERTTNDYNQYDVNLTGMDDEY